MNMGDSVSLVNLAKDLIQLSSMPDQTIELGYTSIRPGEKLFKELYFDEEDSLPTSQPDIMPIYHRRFAASEVDELVSTFATAIKLGAD